MDRIKERIEIKELDMQAVGAKIVAKHPYKIMMDEKQKGVPATELTMFTDVLTFSCHQVGKNFQNIPFTLRKYKGITARHSVALIDKEGNIVENVEESRYNKFNDPAAFLSEKEVFKFKSAANTLIVAMILIDNNARGDIKKYIMLLSEPMTIDTMQTKRDEVVFGEKKKLENKRLESIKMLWGK